MKIGFSGILTAGSMVILGACASSVAQETTAPQADEDIRRHFVVRRSDGDHSGMRFVGRRGSPHGNPHGDFSDMDTDEDGRLSKEEFNASQQEKFAQMDVNGDGYVEEDEVGEFVMSRLEGALERMEVVVDDIDFDFDFDFDFEDGEFDEEEFEAEMERFEGEMEQFGERMGNMGNRVARVIMRNPHRIRGNMSDHVFEDDEELNRRIAAHKDRVIEQMDENGDGKLSKDEYEGSERRFNRMDDNDDGFIDRDELKVRVRMSRSIGGFPPHAEEEIEIEVDGEE